MNDLTDLPDRWQQQIIDSTNTVYGRPYLEAGDFPLPKVTLHFEDGSKATFNYALVLHGKTEFGNHGETAVLTEHCGYHVFVHGSLMDIVPGKRPRPSPYD